MSTIPKEKENPEGLHQRYIISKANGEPVDERAEYFVLRLDSFGDDPHHIEACKKAIITYAYEIEKFLPKLAEDILDKYYNPTIHFNIPITIEELTALKATSAAWDQLNYEIGEFYDENNEKYHQEAAICEIGEIAATAFGYL